MTVLSTVVPRLVFEAADCLMAIPASEVAHLEASPGTRGSRPLFDFLDLGEYFGGRKSDGPWLQWGRGPRNAWLGVRRVVDVVPVAVSGLAPLPVLLRGQRGTRAFLAAGVRGNDVFLLLDPARLTP